MILKKNQNLIGRKVDDNKNHVEFFASETHFSVVIYNANYEKGKEKGKEEGKEITNKIIEQISLNNNITIAELTNVLSTTEKTIRYYKQYMIRKIL